MKNPKKYLYTPPYAEQLVLKNFPQNCKRVLDFGCGDGHFTTKLIGKSKEVYACDPDTSHGNSFLIKDVQFQKIKTKGKTPYKNNYFDCITLMGVLEHVPDEKDLITELYRILKPGGMLFIYVHNKGLLQFLDAANLKFFAPSIHKFLWTLLYSSKSYDKEFVIKKADGMYGDSTEGKKWHTHYSKEDLEKYLRRKFTITRVWHYSFFIPLLLPLEFLYIYIRKKSNSILRTLFYLDSKINAGSLSYNILVACKKN